ncbi:MAG: FKBP-type peptidyl-prolyl cis-trans isomerase 2 [Myxococcota bacterium]|jgi:FKBP-type peptidyl-prolyl cis-trans isomerase 2
MGATARRWLGAGVLIAAVVAPSAPVLLCATSLLEAFGASGLLPQRAGIASADDSQSLTSQPVIVAGSNVALAYTLRLESGDVLDTNIGGEPVRFKALAGQVVAGLDEAVVGMKIGDRKHIRVPPEKGYGARDPLALRPIPLSRLPAEARVPGTELGTEDARGRPRLMRVERIEGDNAIMDFNHPLAGQVLLFDIEVVAVD